MSAAATLELHEQFAALEMALDNEGTRWGAAVNAVAVRALRAGVDAEDVRWRAVEFLAERHDDDPIAATHEALVRLADLIDTAHMEGDFGGRGTRHVTIVRARAAAAALLDALEEYAADEEQAS